MCWRWVCSSVGWSAAFTQRRSEVRALSNPPFTLFQRPRLYALRGRPHPKPVLAGMRRFLTAPKSTSGPHISAKVSATAPYCRCRELRSLAPLIETARPARRLCHCRCGRHWHRRPCRLGCHKNPARSEKPLPETMSTRAQRSALSLGSRSGARRPAASIRRRRQR